MANSIFGIKEKKNHGHEKYFNDSHTKQVLSGCVNGGANRLYENSSKVQETVAWSVYIHGLSRFCYVFSRSLF